MKRFAKKCKEMLEFEENILNSVRQNLTIIKTN